MMDGSTTDAASAGGSCHPVQITITSSTTTEPPQTSTAMNSPSLLAPGGPTIMRAPGSSAAPNFHLKDAFRDNARMSPSSSSDEEETSSSDPSEFNPSFHSSVGQANSDSAAEPTTIKSPSLEPNQYPHRPRRRSLSKLSRLSQLLIDDTARPLDNEIAHERLTTAVLRKSAQIGTVDAEDIEKIAAATAFSENTSMAAVEPSQVLPLRVIPISVREIKSPATYFSRRSQLNPTRIPTYGLTSASSTGHSTQSASPSPVPSPLMNTATNPMVDTRYNQFDRDTETYFPNHHNYSGYASGHSCSSGYLHAGGYGRSSMSEGECLSATSDMSGAEYGWNDSRSRRSDSLDRSMEEDRISISSAEGERSSTRDRDRVVFSSLRVGTKRKFSEAEPFNPYKRHYPQYHHSRSVSPTLSTSSATSIPVKSGLSVTRDGTSFGQLLNIQGAGEGFGRMKISADEEDDEESPDGNSKSDHIASSRDIFKGPASEPSRKRSRNS